MGRFSNHTVGRYAEFPYPGAEQYNAETLAWTWLALYVGHRTSGYRATP